MNMIQDLESIEPMSPEELDALPFGGIRQSESQLIAAAGRQWYTTFDSISDLVIVLGADGRITRMNEASRRLFGRTFEESIGLHIVDFANGQFRSLGLALEQLSARVLSGRTPMTGKARDETSERSWSLVVSPLIDGALVEGTVAVGRESTYMDELEETVRRSRWMAEMGTFVAGVAHEVRNPLFGITANLDALDSTLAPNAEGREFLLTARFELGRLNDLMKDLLDFGRPGVIRRERTSVAQIVETSIAATITYPGHANVTITPAVDPDVNWIHVDVRRLCQALQNLIENAVAFSAPDSTILVESRRLSDSVGVLLEFAVSDSGPGFRSGDVARALEPFFTRRRGGTGLGLAIVRRIAEDHGGRVVIGTSPTGGARVSFTVRIEDLHP